MAGERLKRAIGGIYSYAADRFYEPVVVKGAFKLFGGRLNDLVLAQGRRAVGAARGTPILDLPVGTAYFTIEAARLHDGLVVGVDIAEGMVREAQRAAARAGVDNLVVVRADAHHLPFPDRAFGAVLCTNGLQVIPGTEATLDELGRVLAPAAPLLISVVGVPMGAVLPPDRAQRLPAILRSGRDWMRTLSERGFEVAVRRSRLAWLIEASARDTRRGS